MSDREDYNYEIDLKQGDLRISLTSDDVYFISRQMDKWFKMLMDDSYVPISIPPTYPVKAIKPEPLPQEPHIPAITIQKEPVQPPPELIKIMPTPLTEPPPLQGLPAQTAIAEEIVYQAPQRPVPPPLPEPDLQPVYYTPPPPPTPTRIAQPSPVIRSQPSPEPAYVPPTHHQPVEPLDSAVQDDFETVMDTLMRDLERGDGTPPPYQPTSPGNLQNHQQPVGRGVDLSTIGTLSELVEKARVTNSEDFLILAAYYLTHYEHTDKFSLKRINSNLVRSGLTPVNHSVLEISITKGYLTLVPDMTGMADVSEYTLSETGQQYALNQF